MVGKDEAESASGSKRYPISPELLLVRTYVRRSQVEGGAIRIE
jgi:hypothetical protein